MLLPSSKNSSNLTNRILWFDGDSTISKDGIGAFMQMHTDLSNVYVDEMSDDIQKYNRLVSKDQKITVKEHMEDIDHSWNIPNEFKNIDVDEYINKRLQKEFANNGWVNNPPNKSMSTRSNRVSQELREYARLGLIDVVRSVIFIINTLEHNKIVWGVGRGSSVSSYVLYLIGAHDVDAVEYELDFKDFLRSTK